MDNIADGKLAVQIQAWDGLVLEQAFSAFLHGTAVSAQTGWKARVIWAVCGLVHKTIRFFHIRPALFRAHCEAACRKYERKKTKRMAFLPDTNPFWNVGGQDQDVSDAGTAV